MPSKAQKRKRSAAKRHGTESDGDRDGGVTLFENQKETRNDLSLVSMAVKKRFPITDTKAKKIVDRMMVIIEKTTVQIPLSDGAVFDCESTADKNATAAAKVIQAMSAMNQRDEFEAMRRGVQSKQQSQTVVNVGVSVDNRTNERRNRALAIAERFRDGGILVENTSGTH